MADDPKTLNGSGEQQQPEKPLSLREVAEAAYDEIENSQADDTGNVTDEPPLATDTGQPARDAQGRFVAKTPGEQSQDTAPKQVQSASPTPAKPVDPAAQAQPAASSSQPPQHWSAEDRAMFDKLPQEGKDFLLRRHHDMEADYTQKTQANAAAINFAGEVAQTFLDPDMQRVMVSVDGQAISPQWAISQWASMHKRAMSPDPNIRAGLLRDMAQRLQLDPAAVFGTGQQPGDLSEQDLADPAIRYFANSLGKTVSDMQALRNELNSMRAQDQERQSTEAVKQSRWTIDTFADEKDAQGNLLRPHFDAVLPEIMSIFRADPNADLAKAYETATWMNPNIRQTLITAQRTSVDQQQANARAQQAARSNIRGRTSPVTKPESGEEPKGLRATIAAAADEVGY